MKTNKKISILVSLVAMANFVISTILFINLLLIGMLPDSYLIGFGIGEIIFFTLTMVSMKNRKFAIVMMVLSVLLSAMFIYGILFVAKYDQTIDTITETGDAGAYIRVDVLVLDSDPATDITDLESYQVGYQMKDDVAIYVSEQVKDELSSSPIFAASGGMTSLASELLDGTHGAIIMRDSYIEMIDELDEYSGFKEKVRIIKSYDVEADSVEKVENTDKGNSSGEDSFVIYLSGIDTYGAINTESRSDVNILAVVNQKSGKVQLINTPRDAYVLLPMYGGVYDKLTHAGLYGVDMSMATLEELYDVDIDYYLRVNFTGFEQIIDSLGGIDVESEKSFTSKDGYYYTVGTNHLSGEQALSFARERKAFSDGDFQRGRNQMAVITAIIKAMQSTEMLTNYASVLDSISGCFQTNMTSSEINSIVKRQLDEGTSWEVDSYTTTGTNSSSTTYSIPTKRSSTVNLDDLSIEEAKQLIESALNGG